MSATGTVSFVGEKPTIDNLALGADIKIGNTHNRIISVNPDSLATTVDVPGTAVAAASYTIETPALRQKARAKVTQCPATQYGIASQSEKEGTLSLQCISMLPAPERIV